MTVFISVKKDIPEVGWTDLQKQRDKSNPNLTSFSATNALWNNMLEPIGAKSINWNTEFVKFLCPTETSPYIRTWKNSKMP